MSSSGLSIIVSGMIAGDPHQGGATWAVLQYVLGLQALGHRVLLVEPMAADRVRPAGGRLQDSENAKYFRQVAADFGLDESAALLLASSRETVGVAYEAILQFAKRADLLINVSGMLSDERILEPIPRRVYLDLDPAFVQIWHTQGIDMRLDGHTHFVTVGQSIGRQNCLVPTCGRQWIATLQPVDLQHWTVAEDPPNLPLTTVGNWRGYGSVEYHGVFLGQKAHSLRQFFSLPQRTAEPFLLALSIHPEETRDLAALKENGWRLIAPEEVASSPASYQRFLRSSKAELGIAKSGYVLSRCGWFSDRSACYLASGRPVLAQQTGFSDFLPTGEGLFAFSSIEEVLTAIEAINLDYPRHARAARAIAREHFASDKVLNRLLDCLGNTTRSLPENLQ